jgi:hypothetical protein
MIAHAALVFPLIFFIIAADPVSGTFYARLKCIRETPILFQFQVVNAFFLLTEITY